MESIFDLISKGSERIVDRIVYVDNIPIGILCPSVTEGSSDSGIQFIAGPPGVAKINNTDRETIWATLVETGSIVFGESQEVLAAEKLIADAKLSRTASYLCSIVRNCKDLLSAFHHLSQATVTVVGCGGIGSLTAGLLAGAGIKRFRFIDPDVVEPSNFNRQLFWCHDHIGRLKIEVLCEELKNRFDALECTLCSERINDSNLRNLVLGSNAVVLSADEPIGVGRIQLAEMARLGYFKLVCSGYLHGVAMVELHHEGKQVAPKTVLGNEHLTWRRNPFFVGPSFGPTNAEIAGIVSSILVRELAALPTNPTASETNCFPSVMSWNPAIFPRRYYEDAERQI